MKTGVILIFILISHFAFAAKSKEPNPSERVIIKAQAPCASVLTEDIMGDLIDDLVQLRLRADQAFQAPNQINHALIAFEKGYAELAREVPDLQKKFNSRYQTLQLHYQNSLELQTEEQRKREKQSQIAVGYRLSNRKDVQWQKALDKNLKISKFKYIEFETVNRGVKRIDYAKLSRRLGLASGLRFAIKLSDDLFATAGFEGSAAVWRVDHNNRIKLVTRFESSDETRISPVLVHTGQITSVIQISKNRFATTGSDHTAVIWDVDERGQARRFSRLGKLNSTDASKGHISIVTSISKISENRFITSGHDRTSIIWAVDDQGQAQILETLGLLFNKQATVGHTDVVLFSVQVKDGIYMSGGLDHTAIVWVKDKFGRPYVFSRLGNDHSKDPSVGHVTHVIDAQYHYINDELIILTKDRTDRVLIWEPEYLGAGGEL